jgi:uncharacterized protein (DUF952 family)
MNPYRYIYHVTAFKDWQHAKPTGWYIPPGYAADGFIHCSQLSQVVGVANRFYTGQSGLVLLQISTNRLIARVVYENLEGGADLFPHIYGELNVDAVSQAIPFAPDHEGRFTFPVWLEAECPG